jgi:hypothetical protein
VDKPEEVVMHKESNGPVRVDPRLLPAWSDDPIIIGVLVMVARDLLLIGPDGVRLDMRVKEASSPTHVFQGYFRAKRNICIVMRTKRIYKTDH